MARIEIEQLTKSFGDTPVLRGIDLSIGEGEFLAVLGPSGCGKSTLLRIVAGLEAHDGGHVRMDDAVVDGLAPKARDVAVVFQSYALYPHMTVAQNLALPLVMRDLSRLERLPFARRLSGRVGKTRATIQQAIDHAAQQVEIGGLLDRKPAQLSGGQRQRVALARALIRQPKLFLLDEPLSNLDATLRASTRTEIVRLQKRLGTTTIYVTHDQTEAMTMADRIAIMIDGRIVQVGPAEEIYRRPLNVEAALFIGSPKMNLLDGMAEDGMVRLEATGTIITHDAAIPDGPVRVGVRPEHIAIEATAAQAAIPASVTHQEFLGSEALVHMVVGDPASAVPVIARLDPDAGEGLRSGETVEARFRPDALHLFGIDGQRLELDNRLHASAESAPLPNPLDAGKPADAHAAAAIARA